MGFLRTIDIRGNTKINDKGIIKIVNGLPLLKSFSISETSVTDIGARQIAQKLP